MSPTAPVVSRWLPVFGIVAIYVLAASIIGVQGEFPVNDDWIYTRAVKLFMNTHNLTLHGSAASCYLHILIGATICSLTGFSYTALRIGELVISTSGAIALYLTLIEIGLSRAASFVFTCIYVLNPWILNLGFTFMTDITALSLNNWYFYFIVRTLKFQRYSQLIGVSLILLASLAVRQTAIAYILPNLVVLWTLRTDRQKLALATFALVLVPICLFIALPCLMTATDPQSRIAIQIEQWYGHHFLSILKHHPIKGISQLISGLGQLSCYLGLMVSPLLPSFFCGWFCHSFRLPKTIWILSSFLVAFSVIDLVFIQGRLMPFNGNLLALPWFCIPAIIGKPPTPIPHSFFEWFTAVSFVAAFCLLSILTTLGWLALKSYQHWHQAKNSDEALNQQDYLLSYFFLCALCTMGLVTLQIALRDLDRYYILCLAPILLSIAIALRHFNLSTQLITALPLTLVIGIYSIAAIQDSMNAYRAQWSAIRSLEQQGIKPFDIEGGWQYNALANEGLSKQFIIDRDQCGFPLSARGHQPLANQRFWAVNGEDYMISFSEEPGYNVISHHPYWSAVQWKQREVLALRRDGINSKLR